MSYKTFASSYQAFASRLRTGLAALFAVTVLALPAQAADPVYPLGSRIGLVPPDGMVASTEFSGFADQAKDAVILLAVLPAEAFSQVEKTMDADALKKEGITLDKREPLQLGVGKAFLFTGREVAEKTHYRKWLLVAAMNDLTALVNVQAPESSVYSEQVVRAALMTLSLRATIPDAEQLSLLPFTVGELAGFHVNRVLRGRALMLSDAPSDDAKDSAKDRPRSGEGCGEGFRPSRHPGAFADRRSAGRSDRGGRSRESSRAWLLAKSPGCATSTSRCPNRCASAGNRDIRPWPRRRTQARAWTCRWCNGCASAAEGSCKWSVSGPPTNGRACSPGCARSATASTQNKSEPLAAPRGDAQRGRVQIQPQGQTS